MAQPALWRTRKFHWRVYCVLTADMQLLVYEMGFVHVANKPFEPDFNLDAQTGLG